MGKFLVRVVIIIVSVYFLIAYAIANLYGIDILTSTYVVLFELIVVVYAYSEGKYHCKYLKHTALGIFGSDTLTRMDYLFDFLSVEAHNLIPIAIISLGLLVSLVGALRHFYKVTKLKSKRNEIR